MGETAIEALPTATLRLLHAWGLAPGQHAQLCLALCRESGSPTADIGADIVNGSHLPLQQPGTTYYLPQRHLSSHSYISIPTHPKSHTYPPTQTHTNTHTNTIVQTHVAKGLGVRGKRESQTGY